MSAPLDLAAVKARCAALKHDSGAWYSDDIGGIVWAGPQTIADGRVCDIRGWGNLNGRGARGIDESAACAEMDARKAFIAHARTDVPALVDEVERLAANLDTLRSALSAARAALDELARLHASTDPSDDFPAINLASSLSAPLAAVVRAVADRPWWVTKWSHRAMCDERVCIECGSKSHEGRPRGECSYIAADAALDAFGAPEPPAANAPEPPSEIVNPRARAYCRAVGIPPTVEALRARDGNWASFMAWIAARSREFRIRSSRDVVGADAPFTAFCEEAAARAVAESAGRA